MFNYDFALRVLRYVLECLALFAFFVLAFGVVYFVNVLR
jgi:hypothetical protein